KSWVRDITHAADVRVAVPYRVSPYEIVLALDAGSARLYFKGLCAERSNEPRLTSALRVAAPESFARTLALERRLDGTNWWLMETCPGSPLTRCLSTESATTVGAACAAVQQRIAGNDEPVRQLLPLDLAEPAAWIATLIERRDIGADAHDCLANIARAF